MKISNLLYLMTISVLMCFASCSSDSDDDSFTIGPQNVFKAGRLSKVGTDNLSYNENGLLREIGSATFEYPKNNKTVILKENNRIIRLEIGNNGFVDKAIETINDNVVRNWSFKYNESNQLSFIENNHDNYGLTTTTITYKDGNISEIKEVSEKKESIVLKSFEYTSEDYTDGIDNKGSLMLFDMNYFIDLADVENAFFAGLLGQATKKLPLKMNFRSYIGDNVSYKQEIVNNWKIDEKGYPTYLSFRESGGLEKISLRWSY